MAFEREGLTRIFFCFVRGVGMMYWHDWGVALIGLLHFTGTYIVQTWCNAEMYFGILEEGVGFIGTGALSEW